MSLSLQALTNLRNQEKTLGGSFPENGGNPLPNEFANLKCHHISHPRGHAAGHLYQLPPHWFGGV